MLEDSEEEFYGKESEKNFYTASRLNHYKFDFDEPPPLVPDISEDEFSDDIPSRHAIKSDSKTSENKPPTLVDTTSNESDEKTTKNDRSYQ
jgi:hypothetical protein